MFPLTSILSHVGERKIKVKVARGLASRDVGRLASEPF